MSEPGKTKGIDHGETPVDDTRMSPVARVLFGWTAKPWAGKFMFWLLLALSVILIALEPIAEALTHGEHHFRHAYFGIDATPFFYAMWGFGSFALVVLMGWPLGKLLRRREDYYGDEEEPAGTEPRP